MAPDTDETIKAKILKMLDRKGYYYPKHVAVENVAPQTPVAVHDKGRVPALVHDLARSDADPVRYVEGTDTVALKVDSQRHTAARIAYFDESQLEWSQRERL